MSHPLSYRQPGTPSASIAGWLFASATVLAGLLGNVLAAGLVVASLWDVPRGTPIRPMALAAWMFFVAVGTAGAAFVLAILAVVFSRRRRLVWLLAAIGWLVALTPLPVSWRILDWVVTRHRLILED